MAPQKPLLNLKHAAAIALGTSDKIEIHTSAGLVTIYTSKSGHETTIYADPTEKGRIEFKESQK